MKMMKNKIVNMEQVASAYCPKCQERVEIRDFTTVTIEYPKGANKTPVAKVSCEDCGTLIVAGCDWPDALSFDRAGARVDGFSFARGPVLTDEEIDKFVVEMDSELEQFYKDSYAKTK